MLRQAAPSPGRPAPRSIDLVLTSACNLACGYCYQDDKQPGRMDWATARAALDLLLGSGRDEVTVHFFGGEPLLEMPLLRRAVRHVERARPPGMRVELALTTNGTRLGPATIAYLDAHRFQVHLSFDGVEAAQDGRGRGTFARLDRVLERMRRRHRRLFRDGLTVNVTLTADNLPHLADSIRYFLARDVRRIEIGPAFTHQASWRPERIAELEQAFARILADSIAHERRTGRIPVLVLRPAIGGRGKHARGRAMCNVGKGEALTIDVDGEVHGCVTFADSFQKYRTRFLRERLEAMQMGDVRDAAFPRRLAMYPQAVAAAGIFGDKAGKRSSYGRCAECRYRADCYVCPVSIGNQPGNDDPDRVPDFPCAYHLVALKHRERFPRPRDPLARLRAPGLDPAMARLLAFAQATAPAPRW